MPTRSSRCLGQLGKNLIAMVGASAAAPALAAAIGSVLKTVPGIGTIAGGVVQGLVQALVTRWIGRVFCEYFRNEMQPPPGGLAELARREWAEVTRPEQLRKLIQMGRDRLSKDAVTIDQFNVTTRLAEMIMDTSDCDAVQLTLLQR